MDIGEHIYMDSGSFLLFLYYQWFLSPTESMMTTTLYTDQTPPKTPPTPSSEHHL